MAGRREIFEAQLRDLQCDISALSEKLQVSPSRHASDDSRTSGYLNHKTSEVNALHEAHKHHHHHHHHHKSQTAHVSADSVLEGSGVANLKKQLQAVMRERDEAKDSLHKAQLEIKELHRNLADSVRLRTAHDHMKQDLDAMRVTLESSERIRKQQKALIALIQKTQNAVDGNISAIDVQSLDSRSIDSRSLEARQNQSSMPMPPLHSQHEMHRSGTASLTPSVAMAAENRSWLSNTHGRAPTTSDSISVLSMDVGDASLGISRSSQRNKKNVSATSKTVRSPRSAQRDADVVVASLMDAISPHLRSPHSHTRLQGPKKKPAVPKSNTKSSNQKSNKAEMGRREGLPPRPPPPKTLGYRGVSAKGTAASRAKTVGKAVNLSMTSNSSVKNTSSPNTFGVRRT